MCKKILCKSTISDNVTFTASQTHSEPQHIGNTVRVEIKLNGLYREIQAQPDSEMNSPRSRFKLDKNSTDHRRAIVKTATNNCN